MCQKLTKHPAMVQFPMGSSAIPTSFGSDIIMYTNVSGPTHSIVAHPILPSTLNRDSVDVLPCGYQSSTHCAVVNYHFDNPHVSLFVVVVIACSGGEVCARARSQRNGRAQQHTRGKNCHIQHNHSQFSRDGGSQPCTIAMLDTSRPSRVANKYTQLQTVQVFVSWRPAPAENKLLRQWWRWLSTQQISFSLSLSLSFFLSFFPHPSMFTQTK